MKAAYWLLVVIVLFACSDKNPPQKAENNPPSFILGDFQDDYGIKYTITEDMWLLQPTMKHNILEWVPEAEYLIAQNDTSNANDGGLFTRIDWVELDGMPPYNWAFCISAYNVESAEAAASVTIADRENPRTGCNGFPFSRMQTIASADTAQVSATPSY